MTTERVLEIVKDRGLRVVVRHGHPYLRGRDQAAMTPELVRVLQFHRAEIVRRLSEAGK